MEVFGSGVSLKGVADHGTVSVLAFYIGSMTDNIILVDENDTQIGEGEKLDTHKKGLLHRAFSVYVFNDKDELMLQRRAKEKYHCGGLWTNTTCSHPAVGEEVGAAAHRRLVEEMGFDTELKKVTEFIYKVPFDNGLTEHEYLHVFIGRHNEPPLLNREEAMDWQWITLDKLEQAIESTPAEYTYWMKKTLPFIREALITG